MLSSSPHNCYIVSFGASLFYSALFCRLVFLYNSLVYYTILCAYLVGCLLLTQSFTTYQIRY